jgi:hypothetical protein
MGRMAGGGGGGAGMWKRKAADSVGRAKTNMAADSTIT